MPSIPVATSENGLGAFKAGFVFTAYQRKQQYLIVDGKVTQLKRQAIFTSCSAVQILGLLRHCSRYPALKSAHQAEICEKRYGKVISFKIDKRGAEVVVVSKYYRLQLALEASSLETVRFNYEQV